MDGLRKVREILDQEIVLGAGARDPERVGFLERVAADQLGGYLSGERDDRDGVHHGIDEPGDQVRGAGAGSGAAYADFAGGAGITLRRESSVLLVAHQNVLDLVIVHRVIERQRDAARIAEDAIDAFADEAIQQDPGAAQQRGGLC